MLSAKNVTYAIGTQKLVEDISLEFKTGEVAVIMGQNGAGKSTLLKILAGSLKHFGGEVVMFNKNLDSYSDEQLARIRAVLSQHYDISFPITVEEITIMGRYPYFKNNPSRKDIEICNAALDLMGIRNLLERDYNTLSGGEAQKVQMARVLAQIWQQNGKDENETNDSKILFLDEPVSSLDIHYQHHILQIAKQYASNNVLVIAVLHDINLAFNYADRIIFMKSGKVVKTYNADEKIDKEVISGVFDVNTEIITNPFSNKPLFVVKPY